jgi:diguanylate cyclase (GGDEF)-like protein/PAS domain S-box-containing protein
MLPKRRATAIARLATSPLGRSRVSLGRLRPLQLTVVLAIVAIALAGGAALWHEHGNREESARRAWAVRAADEVQNQYDQAAATVMGVRGLYAASGEVTEEQFARFAEAQRHGSVLDGFAFIQRVPGAARRRFERATGLRIVERAEDGAYRLARRRPVYYPVRYDSPESPSGRASLGLDVGPGDASLPPARDSGQPALTRPITLAPGPNAPLGAAISVAIYAPGAPLRTVDQRRAALVGFAGGTFHFKDLASRVVDELPSDARLEVVADDRTVVGTSQDLSAMTSETLRLGGRRWTVRVGLEPGAARAAIAGAVVGGGLLLAALVALMFGQVNRRRRDREAAQARHGALVQNGTDLITVLDAEWCVAYQSPAAKALLGHAPEALLGTPLPELLHPDDAHAVVARLLDQSRGRGESFRGECRWATAAGGWVSTETTFTNLEDHPDVGGWVLNTRDISERKTLEAELVRQALHDPLTGLANRTLFTDRAAHAFEQRGTAAAVLFCDLDDFKRVNDVLGHHAGDELLTEVAVRLRRCVRAGDTVARLGGDEFAILLEDELSVAEADLIAGRVLAAVRAPLALAGEEVEVTCSVGIATTAEADSTEELLRNADVAMYAAKAAGKGMVAHYEPEMHVVLLDRLSLAADLSPALERGEFRVYYQPLVELEGGGVVGVEALVRWEHPRRGLIAPAQFIPLAEETGQIVELGEVVLTRACHQAVRWGEEIPELASLTMNVNLSARQLTDRLLPERVERALRESGLSPERLVLEITESILMSDTAATSEALASLKALGVRLAIDDFGTGYSSLAYLERLAVDQIKVDKAFIDGIDRTDGEASLMHAILEMGRAIGVEVIAEGVERADQASFLRAAGVDMAQGYYFARPASADQIKPILIGGRLSPDAPHTAADPRKNPAAARADKRGRGPMTTRP